MEHNIEPLNREILTHPLATQHLIHPTKPTHIQNNPIRYPIHSIIDHHITPTKDKYKIIKNINTYTYANGNYPRAQSITKKLPHRELFPYNLPNVIQHNTNIFLTYFTKRQHMIYEHIIKENDSFTQNQDPRHISPPLNIPPL